MTKLSVDNHVIANRVINVLVHKNTSVNMYNLTVKRFLECCRNCVRIVSMQHRPETRTLSVVQFGINNV